MKPLLTDDEIGTIFDNNAQSWRQFARAIEAAVIAAYEAKLRDQAPVAWMEFPDGSDYYFIAYSENKAVKTKPLYANPAPIPEVEAKYNELLMAVAKKFPNETRHETALRYILDREHWTEFKPMAAARSGE